MNQAAFHLANRKELQGAVQNGRLLQAEGSRKRDISNKEWIVSGKVTRVTFLWGKGVGVTRADQVIPA